MGFYNKITPTRISEEERTSNFIRDVMATFKLRSPTLVYEGDEAPEICYEDQWVLCMSSESSQVKETVQKDPTDDGKNIFLYPVDKED